MKHLIAILLLFSVPASQSLYANLTIYKDGHALIKQPVFWEDVDSDQNIIIWDVLPKGIVYSSPFLTLDNASERLEESDVSLFSVFLANLLLKCSRSSGGIFFLDII